LVQAHPEAQESQEQSWDFFVSMGFHQLPVVVLSPLRFESELPMVNHEF
jgi:hypothetical protein